MPEKLYSNLEEKIPGLKNNILMDDRTSLTLGKRLLDAKRVGYQFSIIINKKSAEENPLFELIDIKNNKQLYLSKEALCDYIQQNFRI